MYEIIYGGSIPKNETARLYGEYTFNLEDSSQSYCTILHSQKQVQESQLPYILATMT